VIWASAREVYNVYQAERSNADVITLSPALLDKYDLMRGRSLNLVSNDTVQQFIRDASCVNLVL
jgi:transaldolase